MKRTTFWLAFLGAVKGGKERVSSEIKSLGISAGINFRLGDGGTADDHANETNAKYWIDQFGQSNVTAWQYSRPVSVSGEINLWKKAYSWGLRRFVINGELFWKKLQNVETGDEQARAYVKRMREAFPDCWIAHAPFALRMSHGFDYKPKDPTQQAYSGFPYRGFSGLDEIQDQVYPEEINTEAPKVWLDRYERERAMFEAKYPEMKTQKHSVIRSIYGRDLGPVWRMGAATPPNHWKDASLVEFIDFADRTGCESYEFYSVDAALAETDGSPSSRPWHAVKAWASKVVKEQEALLAERASRLLEEEKALQCLDPVKMISIERTECD